MFDLANEPKQFFQAQNADHNEMDLVKGYDAAIQSFAVTLGKAQPAHLPPLPSPRLP